MRKKKETVPFIRYYSGTYAYHRRIHRRVRLHRILRAAAYILVFILGYFLMELMLQIAMLPPA